MLWTVRHLWPSRARFVFKCYRHLSSIVLCNVNETAIFLHSRKGVVQGDPLEMIAYGISILPLINNIKQEIPDVTQPWYSDDAGDLGTFTIIETYFNSLTRQGPGRGYYPKMSKSILIVHPENLKAGKEFGARHGFKVCTGTHYLRGYIKDNDYKSNWLRECTLAWDKSIDTISKTAGKYPQESYATVVHEIQSEWIFLQCATWYMGDTFTGVEKIILENFFLVFSSERQKPSHPSCEI